MTVRPQSEEGASAQTSPGSAAVTDLISVVVPCFNAQRYIVGALRSVYSQAGVPLEVIVVDDGSTDGSVDTVRQNFPAVTLLQQPNAGVAAARNAGLAAARGRWVAFIDADDYWLAGKLQTQLRLLAAHPEARLACAPWHVWFSDEPEAPAHWHAGQVPAECRVFGERGDGWIYTELLLGCTVWTSTVVADRMLLAEAGGFDTELKVGEDYDLWLRLSRLTPFVRANQPLALYRQHPDSLTRRPPTLNYEGRVLAQALTRWGLTGPDGRQANARAVQTSLARTWHDFGAAQTARGAARMGVMGACRALRADWRYRPAWKLAAKSLLTSLSLAQASDQTPPKTG